MGGNAFADKKRHIMSNDQIQRLKLDRIINDSFDVEVAREGEAHISVRVGKTTAPSLYWEMAVNEFSIIEIGVDERSGQLTKLSTPLYNGTIGSAECVAVLDDKQGMPCFDIRAWHTIPGSMEGNFILVEGRIAIDLIEPDSWVITLYDEPIVTRVSLESKVWFGFNSVGELTHVGLNTKGATEERYLGRVE